MSQLEKLSSRLSTPRYSSTIEDRSIGGLSVENVSQHPGSELELVQVGDRTEDGTHPEQGATPVFVTGTGLFSIMMGVTIVIVLAMLDISIISTAIPQITSDFHRLEDVGWYVGAYQLSSAAVQPLTGKLYDSLALKWTYLCFVFVFEVGSAVCGAASSSTMFIIGRAIAGLGCSGLVNGTLTITTSSVRPEKRPFYTGLAMGISQIGLIIGPLLGGAFTQHATWRWCFYINLPLGALSALFLVFTRIPDQKPKPPMSLEFLRSGLLPRLDLIGFALLAPACIMLLLALQFGIGEYGWRSSEVIGLFCGAGVTAGVFLLWERRKKDEAMIPYSLVAKRVLWASSINYALLLCVTVVGGNFMPIYFQSVKGLSPTMSAVYMFPSMFTQVICIVLSGGLVTKFGYYLPWAAFAGVVTAVGCGLISTWSPTASLGALIGFQFLYGTRGAGMQMGVIAIQNCLHPTEIAVGNSFIVFCGNLLAAVLATVANTIFQETLVFAIRHYAPSVNPQAAIAAGGSADAVRSLAPEGSDALRGCLSAFSDGFGNVFYLLAGLSVISFTAAFGMGWVDVRRQKETMKG